MSNLHHLIYQSYLQLMHRYCQYPQMMKLVEKEKFGSKVRILAIGKAAWKMASLCARSLSEKGIEYDGMVLTKYGNLHEPVSGLKMMEAGHPLPDANSLAYSAKIVDWLKHIPAKDDLIILLSGGSSALFELLPDGLTINELIKANEQFLTSGKKIGEINLLRGELSLLKGGKALDLVHCKHIHVYAVSDVEGNDPHTIGSGPFTPAGYGAKTLDGWRFDHAGKEIRYHFVADNRSFLSQIAADMKKQGFKVIQDDIYYSCTVDKFASLLRDTLAKAHNPRYHLKKPFLHIFGGELSLKVNGSGLGGRCSHLALTMANTISKYDNTALFCFATDGNDNIAGSGGAFVDTQTRNELRKAGIGITAAKENYDSYTALKDIQHILPSPLLATNVNDIYILNVGYDLENPFSSNSKDTYDIFEGVL